MYYMYLLYVFVKAMIHRINMRICHFFLFNLIFITQILIFSRFVYYMLLCLYKIEILLIR